MAIYLRFGIYLLLCLIPLIYRAEWNGKRVFISSDPQIKYYQVAAYADGHKPQACYMPAKKLGFAESFLPIGYPWAFQFDEKGCLFQYPVFFTYLQAPLLVFGLKSVSFVSVLFFFLNFLLLDRIIHRFTKPNIASIFSIFLVQCATPIFLSSLDYSELTITNFFLLSLLLCYFRFLEKGQWIDSIAISLFFASAFFLRPESILTFSFWLLFEFFASTEKAEFFKKHLSLLPPFLFVFVFFVYLNYQWYGHPMGMRGLSLLSDMEGGLSRQYAKDWVADLWGSNFKVGIFQAYPILGLGLFLLFPFQNSRFQRLAWSGLFLIFILPFLSPYRAGVGLFGMRYYESAIYIYLIGVILAFQQKSWYKYAYLIVIGLLYFSYKSDLNVIKQWGSAAKLYHSILDNIESENPDLIVHRGLSLSYLMGDSYLNIPQVAIYNQENWNEVETRMPLGSKILYLEWENNSLVREEFPDSEWKGKFDVSFSIKPTLVRWQKSFPLAHFTASVYVKESNK